MTSERIMVWGVAFVLVGFFLLLAGTLFSASKEKSNIRGGGIIFLGPIPFGYATDKKMFYALLVVGLVLMGVWYFFMRR